MRKVLMSLLIGLLVLSMSAIQNNAKVFTHEFSSSSSTVLQFKIGDFQLVSQEGDHSSYTRIQHPEAALTLEKGKPELPVFSTTIAVPATGNVVLEWDVIQSQTIHGINLYPSQGVDLSGNDTTFHRDSAIYASKDYVVEQSARISEPVVMRDVRLVNISVSPVGWDARSQELEIASEINLTVRYESGNGVNEIRSNRKLSRSFEKLYEANIANWEQVRDDNPEYQQRSILVIYPNITELVTYIESYMDWKRSKGFYIEAHSTAETGTSNSDIKSFIQDCYNSWENPPEYLVLVGDPSGTYSMPTWFENWTNYEGEGDHPYTLLDGDDYISDILIGRISIGSVTDFLTFLSKMNKFERAPNLDDMGYYHRSLLVGDTSPSGLSCIQTNLFVKDMILNNDPEHTFTELYSSDPSASSMDTAINQGVQFFNYRGWVGMSGWSTGNVSGLTNTNKLMNAIILTCDTGSFASGTARTEAVLRAGTPSAPRGGISAIGLATTGTHTQFNNILCGGIFQGLLVYDMRTMGEALFQGKMDLYRAYEEPTYHYTQVFTHWCNLMGDPSIDVWVGEPKSMNADYTSTIHQGEGYLDVTVTDGSGLPIEGAWVTIRMVDSQGEEDIFESGYSDENGTITHEFSKTAVGEVSLVVTKPNYVPVLGDFTIESGDGVRCQNYVVDDDNEDDSIGNDDGQANPGETIELVLTVRNYSSSTFQNVVAVISSDDPYIQITDDTESWETVNSGAGGPTPDDFDIVIAPDAPDGHRAPIELVITADGDYQWEDRFWLDIAGNDLDIVSYSIDEGDGILDPGETCETSITIYNDGQTALSDVYAEISSRNALALTPDSIAYFGNISPGSTVTCPTDCFEIGTLPQILPGMSVEFEVRFYNESGLDETETIIIPIGEIENGDPIAPDAYGYICLDDGDTSYTEAPDYDWIEIDPGLGGTGTNTGITDTSNEDDDMDFFDLPFPVTFYGVAYEEVGICSNGWITFGDGDTDQVTFRNWPIPGGLGPSPMIAAFWDDLRTSGGGVYIKYVQDMTIDAFVIEWSECVNSISSAEETFQIVLYNTGFYSTPTGDTPIKIQYKVFNNVDSNNSAGGAQGNYCTIGLEDHTGGVGLQYSYNNEYPDGASPLGNQRAILFTTVPIVTQEPSLVLVGTDIVGSADDNVLIYGRVSEFNVLLQNSGIESATNVQASISTNSPWITILNAQSDYNAIDSGETEASLQPFQVEVSPWCPDMAALAFTLHVTCDQNEWNFVCGLNCWAPKLEIESITILDENENGYLEQNEGADIEIQVINNGHYEATDITGFLYVDDAMIDMASSMATLGDIAVNESVDLDTPFSLEVDAECPVPHSFRLNLTLSSETEYYVLHQFEYLVGYSEFCELGDNGWSHYALNGGSDEWHLEDNRFYSPGHSWKAGGTDGDDYSDNVKIGLESPEVTLSTGSYLTFRHWMDSEISGNWPGYCYDGGLVEMYYNDNWITLSPIGGYPYLSRGENNPPFDADTGLFAGSIDWESAWFDVTGYSGTVKFRFVFGSDGGTIKEGWYIDNIMITDSYQAVEPPVELSAILTAPNQIELQWAAPDEVPDSYRVYRSPGVDQPFVMITETGETDFIDTDSYSAVIQYYAVTSVVDGNESIFSNTAQVETDYSGQGDEGDVPRYTHLECNYPNPFNPTTCIRYSLAQDAKTELKIYNVRGQLVRTLVSEAKPAGNHQVYWHGMDENRKPVSSGVYFYKFKAGDYTNIRKMLLIK